MGTAGTERRHGLVSGGVGGVGVHSVADPRDSGGDGDLGVASAIGAQVVRGQRVGPSSVDGSVVVVSALGVELELHAK